MLSANFLFAVSLAYVAALFTLAFAVDRGGRWAGLAWLRSPMVYTLSLSVYCTAWTFYGAVGSAARNGLEFATIYLGPTLVFVGWWWLLRKIVRIGRAHRITSIADMVSSRFGKSGRLAALATLMAVLATTPYIALQLQSVTLSFAVMTGRDAADDGVTAFVVASGMALFTILFGTRNLDANERHYGVVAAIAVEAVVKLTALIAVGVFAIWGVSGGIEETFARTTAETLKLDEMFGPRWMTLLVLAGAAVICLPRQFLVTVVENTDERHLATASWMFPLYLFLLSIFVLPIAAAGMAAFPEGANPDMFVITLPLAHDQPELATLAFIGGFSSATSMVIVSTIALSMMVSNHIVAPIWLRAPEEPGGGRSGDVRRLLLNSRRIVIIAILLLGYFYMRISGGTDALAAIGLIAFAGAAQVMPSLIGGIFWRGATKMGALAGLSAGAAIWIYALFLPSFGPDAAFSASMLANGPFGFTALRPESLFGTGGDDPLVHATIWSLGLNVSLFVTVSLATRPSPMERLQGALFVDIFRSEPAEAQSVVQRSAASEDLFVLAQRIMGAEPARILFARAASAQGRIRGLPEPTPAFIARLERELAGSIGAASARAMVNRTAGGETISMPELMTIADETAKLMETTQALETKSRELQATAAQLRAANERLTTLDMRKDEFLSQVSHELRTPMTSIRSFAEILLDADLGAPERDRFAAIIHGESQRLTRLLDEILDLSFLEKGDIDWSLHEADADAALSTAVAITLTPREGRELRVVEEARSGPAPALIEPDRLQQVFVNLLGNAIKHNQATAPEVRYGSRIENGWYIATVADNGAGVPEALRERIFDKFARGPTGGGAGLGLAISREIISRLGGSLDLAPARDGACFEVRLPLAGRAGNRSS